MSINCEIPDSLKELQPLLSAMNLELSTHFHPPNQPEATWAIINKKGEAGRVGMTVQQARKEIIDTAIARLNRYRLSLSGFVESIENQAQQIMQYNRLRD